MKGVSQERCAQGEGRSLVKASKAHDVPIEMTIFSVENLTDNPFVVPVCGRDLRVLRDAGGLLPATWLGYYQCELLQGWGLGWDVARVTQV
eukprot:667523-Pyramimonas_sp.AAC.1